MACKRRSMRASHAHIAHSSAYVSSRPLHWMLRVLIFGNTSAKRAAHSSEQPVTSVSKSVHARASTMRAPLQRIHAHCEYSLWRGILRGTRPKGQVILSRTANKPARLHQTNYADYPASLATKCVRYRVSSKGSGDPTAERLQFQLMRTSRTNWTAGKTSKLRTHWTCLSQ